MKKINKLKLVASMLLVCICGYGQFTSVQNGSWNDPLTWSTDPDATAIPDENNDVLIAHTVTVTSPGGILSCKSLTILKDATLTNRSSDWVSGDLEVKEDLSNFGFINPAYDMTLKIGGDFINYGAIKRHHLSGGINLELNGDLMNVGSFREIMQTTFVGDGTTHQHSIKSLNDSILYLNKTRINDTLGILIIDSLVRIHAELTLNKSLLLLPEETTYPNTLVFENNSYVYSGKIEANGNKILTNNGWCTLGHYNGPEENVYISNAKLDGNFIIGGNNNPSSNTHCVYFNDIAFNGRISSQWQSNTTFRQQFGLNIQGYFENNGEIYSNGNGNYPLDLLLNNGSHFKNLKNKIDIRKMVFSGTNTVYELDSVSISEFTALEASTSVTIKGDVVFKDKTVDVNFNGGTLVLDDNKSFNTNYMWYNKLRNINIEANGSEITFAIIKDNVSITNPNIGSSYFGNNASLFGHVKNMRNIFPEHRSFPTVKITGTLENLGSIKKHNSDGDIILEITEDLIQKGTEWSNQETRLIGTKDQFILLPDNNIITGKVVFDAMIEGESYQWQKDGADIEGATAKLLTFANGISAAQFGSYQCKVNTSVSRTILVEATLPPAFAISNVIIKNLDDSTTLVKFTTSVPTSGFIFYAEDDTTSGYPLEEMEDFHPLKTNHSFTLKSLTKGSTYYFMISQEDANANYLTKKGFNFVAGDLTVGAVNIQSILDVPDDQGGWVYVNFGADILDSLGEITSYGIWEWMNDEWVSLGYVPAKQQVDYTFLAHTYQDSIVTGMFWSKFYISSHSLNPLIHYSSQIDSGYSLDNIAPEAPKNIEVQWIDAQAKAELNWDDNVEDDFHYYIIYRDGIKHATSIENSFSESLSKIEKHEYQVSAVDYAGNTSERSKMAAINVGIEQVNYNAIKIYPNPANNHIQIQTEIPFTNYLIYDLKGKLMLNGINTDNTIQLHNLVNGVYIVELKGVSNYVTHQRIIVKK